MSERRDSSDVAFDVADRIRSHRTNPWDVYGESIRRYELHLNGTRIELLRGPILLEGYGIRDFEPREKEYGVGFASSTDATPEGIERTLREAEEARRHASFPARSVELPVGKDGPAPAVETIDRALWDRPEPTLESLAHDLAAPFDGRSDAVASFGSVRASLVESTLTNSSGVERRWARTKLDLEFAVKSRHGPEGPPPGEYWVNLELGALDPASIQTAVYEWCRKARDAANAGPTPSGRVPVVLPPEVLSDVLPPILGFRLGGAAALRGMMPIPGTRVGAPGLDIFDDGLLPHAIASAPCDDEGAEQGKRQLLRDGVVADPLYDALHAGAFDRRSTASGRRDPPSFPSWFHFIAPPTPGPSTLVVRPGMAGSDAELIESVGDGIWVDQLGWAAPDPVSAAYGGEVRLAYRIRNGRLAEPIRGGTIGGVVLAHAGEPSLLASTKAIGSQGRLVGRLLSPPIGIEKMAVAGA